MAPVSVDGLRLLKADLIDENMRTNEVIWTLFYFISNKYTTFISCTKRKKMNKYDECLEIQRQQGEGIFSRLIEYLCNRMNDSFI
jgi:hypothetical protein